MKKTTEPKTQNRRISLRARINFALLAIGLLMLASLLVQGYVSQRMIVSRYWGSLLQEAFVHVQAEDQFNGDESLPSGFLWGWRIPARHPGEVAPPPFAELPLGYFDDQVEWGDREYAALVKQVGSERVVLALDLTELDAEQNRSVAYGLLFVLFSVLLVGAAMWWLARHLSAPVRDLAERMERLRPDAPEQRLPTGYPEMEIARIAAAANTHLDRVQAFVERERTLLDQASHEFRTPIAVIGGAADVLRALPDLPASAERPLRRIEETAEQLHQIMAALLYLAREQPPPESAQESCDLQRLLPELVADHEHLLQYKPVAFRLSPSPPLVLPVPEVMLRIAIGNLLRNAAENTDAGRIDVALEDGALRITDTGTGFDPERATQAYNRRLRETSAAGAGGLGLFLIQRICERFGWRMRFEATAGGGTRATLDLGAGNASGG